MFYEVSKVIVKTSVETVKVNEVTDETRVLIDKSTVLFVGTRRVIDRITALLYETRDMIEETPTRQIKRSTYQIKYCKPTITADLVTEGTTKQPDKTQYTNFV
jgi:hypothetical protein